jgi:hypothetical protein
MAFYAKLSKGLPTDNLSDTLIIHEKGRHKAIGDYLKERRFKMKRYVLITVLMAMFFSTPVFSQDPDEGRGRPEKDMGHRLRLRRAQLELEERESDLNFQQQMRELELEQRRMELQCQRAGKKHKEGWKHKRKDDAAPLLIIIAIVHILTAVWVYQDIRKRSAGSGIWIVIALLTGLLGTLVYAVVRLGDTKQTPT